jgi:hypothetical protein
VIRNRTKVVAERRRAERKAKHKQEEIAKRERNDRRAKHRKMKEIVISSDKDNLEEKVNSNKFSIRKEYILSLKPVPVCTPLLYQ